MPRLTITEVARRCGVHKSTVSRQARAHGLVGEDGLVDLDDYERLRAGGLDPLLQTTGRAAARPTNEEPSDLVAERTRKMAADAAAAEINLARLRGELVELRTVQSAVEDLGRRLRERVMNVARDKAAECAMAGDELAIEGILTLALRSAFETTRLEIIPDGGAGGAA
jgi:transposase-like protein